MQKIPLSLVVITLNEESNIQRCLQSVPFASDIVVVDSFSTDRTVNIAESCGARVVQEKWRGYGAQKAFATELATQNWVLSLDADEALSPELQAEILEKFANLNSETGYRIPRLSFHLGRWIRFGGWHPDYQLRLFNKSKARWNSAELHEKVEVKSLDKLKHPILHWVFKGVSDQAVTNDRYSTIGAEQMHREGRKFYLVKLILKPVSKFVETYFWKLGFLDGLPGFIISVGAAYSMFLKMAKLWEIENRISKKDQ